MFDVQVDCVRVWTRVTERARLAAIMTTPALHSVLLQVTDRVRARSAKRRTRYLDKIDRARERRPSRATLSAANLAHAMAAAPAPARERLRVFAAPTIGIVTAYNDMLSAHAPYAGYPARLKEAVARAGGAALVAGGVPAMCDGVTQGNPGMELSLLSREVIALGTAIALTHDLFDGALYLGICDKIVPGLLIGALAFGHLPAVFVPAGPMPSGISNAEKARARELHAQGKLDDAGLLEAEARSYHAPGTCTFYGTANSNQVLMELLGLHLPGAAFVPTETPLRHALTEAAGERVVALCVDPAAPPLGRMLDERSFVNAVVGLLATGGSTNHTLHLPAMARAAGIELTWDDIDALARAVPLIARVYPSGEADINAFHAAGGTSYVIGELLGAGLLHGDVATVAGPGGLARYVEVPTLIDEVVSWAPVGASGDESIVRPAARPFDPEGGLRVVRGNLGEAIIKTSAVARGHRVVQAPARVFASQEALQESFAQGTLTGDFVAVIPFQGPRANGMPELHRLTPVLTTLQSRGQSVALVTDGRMSGASGKVLAAIHVTPEAAMGGPLAKVRDGDVVRLDAERGELQVLVDEATWRTREAMGVRILKADEGWGRELFASLRSQLLPASAGAGLPQPDDLA